MAATLTRLFLAPDGSIAGGVIPNFDSQLSDPAFSPHGYICINVDRLAYKACATLDDVAALASSTLAKTDPVFAQAVATATSRIDTARAEAWAKVQADAELADAQADPAAFQANLIAGAQRRGLQVSSLEVPAQVQAVLVSAGVAQASDFAAVAVDLP